MSKVGKGFPSCSFRIFPEIVQQSLQIIDDLYDYRFGFLRVFYKWLVKGEPHYVVAIPEVRYSGVCRYVIVLDECFRPLQKFR